MKRIFDPDMFDFQWESIDHNRYIVGTYYIEDTLPDQDWIEHLGQVQRMALEGSTSSWMRVKEDSHGVREKLTSKVLGYYEVPTDKPHTKAAVVQLGFPIDAWDTNLNIPMLLLSIAGNAFAFSSKVRVLDVFVPKAVADRFKGPKYGISGIREKLGVYDRPLVLHIIKPKMGMTPEETANQVYQTALGGADLCKDDEMLSDLGNSSWEKRLEAVLKAIDRAERETGHKMLYMLSITDEVDKINEKARKAVEMGASGLLLAYSAGLSSLQGAYRR
jgi:2,3-diketo-5-methylthiopentyl-1-phosphate enolase